MFAELARRTQQLGPDHTPQLADLQEDAEMFTVTCEDTEEPSTRPFLDWVYWTFCMATEVPLDTKYTISPLLLSSLLCTALGFESILKLNYLQI